MELPGEIRFDGWTLHRSSGELVKGGVRVRLPAQPQGVLEELLARPGDVVTREQLVARLWPKGVVEFDTALNSAVRRLRTALGDHAATARYIETIPKRGYRFIGTLDPPQVEPAAVFEPPSAAVLAIPRRRRWMVAAAVVTGIATLLVLVAGVEAPGEPVGRTSVDRVATMQTGSAVPHANEIYVRARHLLQRRAAGDVARSLENFTQVVMIDPAFAPAWAGLASAYWLETVEGHMPASQGLLHLRAAAERAIELDPGLAEAHLRLANYWARSGRRDISARHKAAAFAAEPDDPLVLGHRAWMAAEEGRLDEAIELQRRAIAVEPLSVVGRHYLATWLYLAGRPDEAREALLAIREIDPGATNPGGMMSLVLILGQQFESALAVAKDGPRGVDQLQALALAYSALGHTEQADRMLAELLDPATAADPIQIAEVYAYRGQPDLAFEWLHAAIEREDPQRCVARSCWPLGFAERLPLLAPLRADPRWEIWKDSVQRRQSAAGLARRG
jgi:DNA-binding winged helix-turn-helix (wHTH) protein/tetratricopeptide (TPR) repeat protein